MHAICDRGKHSWIHHFYYAKLRRSFPVARLHQLALLQSRQTSSDQSQSKSSLNHSARSFKISENYPMSPRRQHRPWVYALLALLAGSTRVRFLVMYCQWRSLVLAGPNCKHGTQHRSDPLTYVALLSIFLASFMPPTTPKQRPTKT